MKPSRIHSMCLAAGSALLFAMAGSAGPADTVAGARLAQAIEQRLANPDIPQWPGLDMDVLQAFYAGHQFTPLWLDPDSGMAGHAVTELVDAIRDSDQHGLAPEDYHFPGLLRYWSSVRPEEQALLELLLTDALARYARDLHDGRTEARVVDQNWHIGGDRLDVPRFLAEVSASGDVAGSLAALVPRHPGYQRLTEALDRYRRIAAYGGWPSVAPGPTLRPGESGPRIETLRWRLWLEGHLLDPGADPYHYDPELEQAVRRFQRLHTLEEDGLVGPDTLAALNVSVEERIAQIRLNLERWRWLPRHLDQRYIMINMAGFELRAYHDSEPALAMRVIIGKPFRSTPSFAGKLTHLVFNPYWNVPRRIAEEDLIPAQTRDDHYLQARNIRVLESWNPDAAELDPAGLDWASLSGRRFPYRLRQDPGPRNSLGRIKFMLPNPFSIYLHDTPDRHLFDRTVRTFSSGCIRVEDPEALALFLLDGGGEWDREALRERIASGETDTRYLARPVPVYLVYLTAWVDGAGQLHFADDIYSRDHLLAVRLADD